jgi:hypothetical protein
VRTEESEQRFGRIARQGNMNPEVEFFCYVTEVFPLPTDAPG